VAAPPLAAPPKRGEPAAAPNSDLRCDVSVTKHKNNNNNNNNNNRKDQKTVDCSVKKIDRPTG
jgi:hypothetical protein